MKALRIAICALVVFSVAAHGAVEDWARAVFETFAGLLLVFWAVRLLFTRADNEGAPQGSGQESSITPLLPPLVLLAFLALGQLVLRATASGYSTRMELNLLVADCIVLFLAAQVFRESDGWRTFVWFIIGFGFLVS